ncbi:ABC transporter ATP-binding protein [Pelagibius litoralis]|uniref:ABC transporter ATP-binding protein n=1 Tax=Pelagibius litoralis TaxID=374515 RepID=A0A967KH62_9PROT|nr:ABC transporter ATP-binding protein [Pelagibius litoralis]
MQRPAVTIEGLTVTLPIPGGVLTAVKDMSFSLKRGETLGIVGESGSGKSMTAHALMGLLPSAAQWTAERVELGGHNLLTMSQKALATEVRGREVGMIFQEPMTALNPVYSIGRQLAEGMTLHGGTARAAKARAIELLNAVGLPNPEERFNQYPHQFSGGQRQRIVIAMALMNEPDVLIADEPTTALDVTIQKQILDLLKDLQDRLGIAIILISHDFGVVANFTDRVMVMLKGEVVEQGATRQVVSDPQHDYTRRLIDSIPRPSGRIAQSKLRQPMITVEGVSRSYYVKRGLFGPVREIAAVNALSLTVGKGETLAVVGESGSGKSTLSRLILGLEAPDKGRITLDGVDVGQVPQLKRARVVQPIFQDPYGSLNPRMSVSEIIRRPLDIHGIGSKEERRQSVQAVMEQTGLTARFTHAYPNQMSGGQRQRVAIARALILRPEVVICDEPTSALDVSIQAQILSLLTELREELGLTLVLITHDLAIVEQMADRVVVMQNGKIVEEAHTDQLFAAPQQAYTKQLLASVPSLESISR